MLLPPDCLPGIADLIGDIDDVGIPDIDIAGAADLFVDPKTKDVFDNSRKAWHDVSKVEPRCDFSPGRALLKPKSRIFVLCLWRKSPKGRTFSEIKNDPACIPMFSDCMSAFIHRCVGHSLKRSEWALLTPPPRRHLEGNFAQSVAKFIAPDLGVDFVHDAFRSRNRQRVNAEFDVVNVPAQNNLIIFDDILTTGSTMLACHRALQPFNKNIIFFAAICNE